MRDHPKQRISDLLGAYFTVVGVAGALGLCISCVLGASNPLKWGGIIAGVTGAFFAVLVAYGQYLDGRRRR